MIAFVVLLGMLPPESQPADRPAPLKSEQVAKLRALVGKVRQRDAALKKQLAAHQRALRAEYASFRLDEKRVARLRKAVTQTQSELLSNYHHLQVELRKIVGKERFVFLKRRIDNALEPNSKSRQGSAKRPSPKPKRQPR